MISKWRVMSDANVDRFSFRNIGCMSWFRSSAQRSTEILIFRRRNEVNLRYLYQMLLRDVCDMSNALKNAAKSSNETDSNTKTDWKHSPINVPKRKKRRETRNILTQVVSENANPDDSLMIWVGFLGPAMIALPKGQNKSYS